MRPTRRASIAASTLGALALVGIGTLGCSAVGTRGAPSGAWTQGRAVGAAGQAATAVMDFASAQVGKRYCWGGTGPSCFDCSGLVQRAWASVGVRLPRTADAIASELPEVSLDAAQLRAGDILWWPGHVGLYAGNGWVVEALDRRHGVILRPIRRTPHRVLRPAG